LPGLAEPSQIGQGGFAVVYRAIQVDIGSPVAVKVLNAAPDPAALERFDRERKAMGRLQHPNIVRVSWTGTAADGRPFIVMELADTTAAARLTESGPFEVDEVVRMGIAIADALEAAHQAGILHRDIKPENLLLSRTGAPKLADFGIARVEGSWKTSTGGNVTATLAYAAPEVLDGKPPSAQSDIYSLAATLVGMMRGRPPFVESTDESLTPMLRRILEDPPPDLSQYGVSEPVRAVFSRALEKDPADRYESAAAFGAALAEAHGIAVDPGVTRVIAAGAAGAAVGATAAAARTASIDDTSATQARGADDIPPDDDGSDTGDGPTSRRWLVAGLIGLLVVGLLAVAAFVALRDDEEALDTATGDPSATGNPSTEPKDPTNSVTTTEPTPTTEPAGPVTQLEPVGASASATIPSQGSSCEPGVTYTYAAFNAIDGDFETGWGVHGNGEGATLTIDLPRAERITRVGLTPGYTKTGPRTESGCAPMSAFDLNRQVQSVLWRFDDGTEIEQDLPDTPAVAYLELPRPVTSQSVEMVIQKTTLPPGADDDTIISEVELWG
jgi:hypothetical protein